ncbi:MAG: hypothetical protein K9J17_08040 [Flavobacteriales bacterium]|nr:hypothetical protein [Flavobacteriales bacterium]
MEFGGGSSQNISHLRSVIRKRIVICLFLLPLLYFNARLLHSPDFKQSGYGYLNKDVYAQQQFLKKAIDQGADTDMQRYFPEGFVFLNVLYGLTWCELAEHLDHGMPEFHEAQDEVIKTYKKLSWATTEAVFPEGMQPERGVFYAGWKNYLLARMIKGGLDGADPQFKEQFESNTNAIVAAYEDKKCQFLDSYPGMTWPADNVIAVASVAIYDEVEDQRHADFLKGWKRGLLQHLDENGLIPHQTQSGTDRIVEGARGSSQSLMLIFLKEYAADISSEHFKIYRSLFLTSRIGLPGILEYPKGIEGHGDVDSGPVLFGVGGSASIVGIRTLATYNDFFVSNGIRNSVEAFGVPYSVFGKKKYLFGKMPMADAFIAWANATAIPDQASEKVPFQENWRLKCLIPSSMIMLVLLFLFARTFR